MGTSIDTSNSLVTLYDVKKYLGGSTSSTANNYRLNSIIDEVSWRFNSETKRLLKSRSLTEYYDGDNSFVLLANQYPITSVSTSIDIRVDVDRSYSTSDKISSTAIVIYSTEGKIVLTDDVFEYGSKSVKVVYTGGYTTIPHDLAGAAKEMIRLKFNKETKNRVGVRSESVSGGSITYENDLPWSVKRVLDLYTRKDRRAG
jgi:hypothetical protein